MLTALLALVLIEPLGWKAMSVVGGVVGLLTLPALWFKLPESEVFPQAVRSRERGEVSIPVRNADVVKGRYLMVSLGLRVASFMGLLLVYGLNTWLPKIMDAGYSIQGGTVGRVGAIVGPFLGGVLALATVPAHLRSEARAAA